MPKKQRKVVPAALHSELVEYASLLRALRTSDTLDLSSHLLNSSIQDEYKEADLNWDDQESCDNKQENTTGTEASDYSSSPSKKRKVKTKGKSKDLWTRWPLLAGDVHIPEWSLEDEVKSLALHYFRSQDTSVDDAEEEDEEDRLPPSALNNLTLASSAFLSHLFALLASHIPFADKSLQNRLKPLGWENVLAISGTSGLISADTLESVQCRLEAIYGVTESKAVLRTRSLSTAHDSFLEICSSADSSLLNLNVPRVASEPKKRKRGTYNITGKYKRKGIITTSQIVRGVDTPDSQDGLTDPDSNGQ